MEAINDPAVAHALSETEPKSKRASSADTTEEGKMREAADARVP
jgi:hypothetical protein